MGCGYSRVEPQPGKASAKAPQPGKASAKAPPPSFAALIDAGTVVPDEHDGPYALGSYHDNVTGEHRGYKAQAGIDVWHATNKAIMARQTSWATIDFEAEDAVDPEYMFSYGAINGIGVTMRQLRPTVIAAQAAMKAGYGAAFESARGKQGAAEAFLRPQDVVAARRTGDVPADLSPTRVALVGNKSVVFDWSDRVRDDVYAVDDLLALAERLGGPSPGRAVRGTD